MSEHVPAHGQFARLNSRRSAWQRLHGPLYLFDVDRVIAGPGLGSGLGSGLGHDPPLLDA